MVKHECSDAIVYVCHNCMPETLNLPRQWSQEGVHVQVKELPCTGKISIQYVFHAFEGGCRGVCVVACPPGDCRLSQGNYRAEMRINTVRRLLAEAGLEPERAQLIHYSKEDGQEGFEDLIRAVIRGFIVLDEATVIAGEETVMAG
jgi:coenzyme F420-reducing hydrogenase delta subunit